MASNSMGLDHHTSCLGELCRFCGKRVSKARGPGGVIHKVKNYRDECRKYDIDTDSDIDDIHPSNFCHACYCKLLAKVPSDWKPKNYWGSHKRHGECISCTLYADSTHGGRPKKQKSGGRPANPKTSTETHFEQLGLRNELEKCKLNSSFVLDSSSSFIVCCVCTCIVSHPVETSCHHFVCVDCMKSLFVKVTTSCPTCHTHLHGGAGR